MSGGKQLPPLYVSPQIAAVGSLAMAMIQLSSRAYPRGCFGPLFTDYLLRPGFLPPNESRRAITRMYKAGKCFRHGVESVTSPKRRREETDEKNTSQHSHRRRNSFCMGAGLTNNYNDDYYRRQRNDHGIHSGQRNRAQRK